MFLYKLLVPSENLNMFNVWQTINRKVFLSVYVDYCSVGVKDRRVTDAQMTASSIYNNQHAAYQGRLDYQGSSNPFRSAAWVSARTLSFAAFLSLFNHLSL